jgi:hypothetical protein
MFGLSHYNDICEVDGFIMALKMSYRKRKRMEQSVNLKVKALTVEEF